MKFKIFIVVVLALCVVNISSAGEGEGEWSKVGFRGLTPVAPDSKDMGLRLKINFALNSYELTKTAQQHLDELGEELAVRVE